MPPYGDRKAMAAGLRAVYTACDADAAYAVLADFSGTPLGKKYPAAVAVWERAWDRFIPFLEYGPAMRKVLYTTNAIVILSFRVSRGCDLRRPVVDSVGDRTLAA